METKESILQRVFGYSQFRGGQAELIDGICAGRDVFGVMPTGGGKSLCYQIPALLLPGVTLVISPLISLMHDQVMALKGMGVAAAYVNSSLTQGQIRLVYRNIQSGMYKIIYVAPERLLTDGFLDCFAHQEISVVAVDEAHCISQWGQDFRPSYLKIVDFLKRLPRRPVVSAFTATATAQVREDVERALGLRNPVRVITGFDRPNLYFDVRRPGKKPEALLELVQERSGKSGIIYCATRKNVEKVCALLQENDVPATRYHAGLSERERHDNQEDFLYDRAPVMVATNAFGMGIDKSNVSYVIHYNMPQSLEDYYQEAGRAGRDGTAAECILLFSAGDVETARWMIFHPVDGRVLTGEEAAPDLQRLEQMVSYCKGQDCLRGKILNYFGQEHREKCGNCSNCNADLVEIDVTQEARAILSCIVHIQDKLGFSLGATAPVRVLTGSRNQKILQYSLDQLPEYGSLHYIGVSQLRRVNEALREQDYVWLEPEHHTLQLTDKTREILVQGKHMTIRVPADLKILAVPKEGTEVPELNVGLYNTLKELRLQLAQEIQMPAFYIFSNATLEDMTRKAPQTMEEFMAVSGVGSVKAQHYGKTFLAAIRDYQADEGKRQNHPETENADESSKALQKAREYEASAPDCLRPAFHVTPTVGWMNDPNGFSVYRGEYHLFYQYHPYSTSWGPMHWGHVKTSDFIRWERLPAALAPDAEYDKDGCYSGSALELPDGRQLLVYTGVRKATAPGGEIREAQTQCLALGDGLNYEKYAANPVLDSGNLPAGSSASDFRDPKVWQEPDGGYRMVVANRDADGSGAIRLFASPDALHWHFVGTVDVSHNRFGKMWECPDFFPLGDRQVLMLSPQNMPPMGLDFHPGNNTAFLLGDMRDGQFIRQSVQPIDFGLDFYAPQTLLTPDGRRVMIAWLQNWETAGYKMEGIPWFGQMTLPRELRLEGKKILQAPVRELEKYHTAPVICQNVALDGEVSLPGVSGRVLDMTVTLRPESDLRSFTLRFAANEEYGTDITWNVAAGTMTLDRSASGLNYDTLHTRTFPVSYAGDELRLRLILDRFSAELFVNDGAQTASVSLHTPQSADGIFFHTNGRAKMDVEKYSLEW